MFPRRGDDLIQDIGHRPLLVPPVPGLPTFGSFETFAIRIARVVLVPGFLRVLAETEWAAAARVIRGELNPEDIQKELTDLVPGKDLIHHAQNILAVGRVQTGYVPAVVPALKLSLLVGPTPVGVA